jgi:hypothetical protein
VGLSAGAYDDLRTVGNLIDEVTLAIRAGEKRTTEGERLGDLLVSMVDQNPRSMAPVRLASLLRNDSGGLEEWLGLGERLRQSKADSSELDRLEKLARVVEHAARQAAARLRGHGS